MSRLPIDEMNEDTRLALNYFKENNFKFYSMKIKDVDKHQKTLLSDGFNEIIPIEESTISIMRFVTDRKDSNDLDCELMKLKQLIELKQTLFGQIEYLIRKVPVEDVLMYDIELIIKNLLLNTHTLTLPVTSNCILMDNNTPLLYLGLVVQILKKYTTAYILADRLTAAVCYLFSELCEQAGLASVIVVFCENPSQKKCGRTFSISESGCVGVITENADVDSAVDTLLETTDKYPWKLKQILVQESAYDVFKKAVQWKTRDTTSQTPKKKLCSQVFDYKNKTFLLDYVGSEREQEIRVEAYRTTKELVSLLSKSDYDYMTLWTSSQSEASEISRHPSASNLVWINDYGTFDGPPASLQVIYGNILVKEHVRGWIRDEREVVYLEKYKKWLQLPFSERFDKIFPILCKYDSNANIKRMKEALKYCKNNHYVSVSNGKVCEYSFRPITYITSFVRKPDNLTWLAEGLLLGAFIDVHTNDVVFKDKEIDADLRNVILDLGKAGVPIAAITNGDYRSGEYRMEAEEHFVTFTKVIYSNYGSIFAN